MSLPLLPNWDNTRIALHHAAQVLGAINNAYVERQPNHLHRSLVVVPEGIATQPALPVGVLTLDFALRSVVYSPTSGQSVTFPLMEHTQVSLAAAVLDVLAQAGHEAEIDRDEITHDTPLEANPQHGFQYAGVQHAIAAQLERFRAELPGEKSPVVVWPHGFDVSFLWFATADATEQAPHMAFGFSPSSAGFDRPYVYSYPWPVPDGVTDIALPPPAYWHTEGWTGTVLRYDNFRVQPDPEAMLAESIRAIYASLSPLLG